MDILPPTEALNEVFKIIVEHSVYPVKSIGIQEIHDYFNEKFRYDLNNSILMLIIDKLMTDRKIVTSANSYTSYYPNSDGLTSI